jgi:hypothetical protein
LLICDSPTLAGEGQGRGASEVESLQRLVVRHLLRDGGSSAGLSRFANPHPSPPRKGEGTHLRVLRHRLTIPAPAPVTAATLPTSENGSDGVILNNSLPDCPRKRATAKISLAHTLILLERLAGPARDHRPGLEHIAAMGRLERIARVLLDQ